MRFLAIISLLLLISVAAAEEIDLTVYEQKDFGPSYEEDFDEIEVTMDCSKETLYIQIEDEDVPVTGAVVRIIYVDYSTPLLASGPTDAEGEFSYTLVGEIEYMGGLFLVVVEKEGYLQKEAHFDISNCLDYQDEEEEPEGPLVYDTTPPTIPESEFPEPEPEPETPPEEEPEPEIPTEPETVTEEPIPEPEPVTEENLTDLPEPNLTGNLTGNITGNETGEEEGPETEYLCVSSFIFLLAAVLLVLYH